MLGRWFLVLGTWFVLFALNGEIARGEGHYQFTRDGKTLVWNSDPKPGDVATWSGGRDANDYAKGFGQLVWYTKDEGSDKPELYARYWGRMVDGKLEGPINVHSKRKTHYAIFIEGSRMTGWARGTAPTSASARWSMMVAKRGRATVQPPSREERASAVGEASDATNKRGEPEAPAVGPAEEPASAQGNGEPQDGAVEGEPRETISDLYSERWPKIDVDDSIRLLAFPPRTLRK